MYRQKNEKEQNHVSQTNKKPITKVNMEDMAEYPFPCLNCSRTISEVKAKLYCSGLCDQEAHFVRYARRCRQDGRDKKSDVQEAIQIKLAMIVSGGYPEQERQVPEPIRAAVIRRDGGRCKKCGKPGIDIDHIQGSSNEMENLQFLCRECHNEKTKASFVPITPESHPEAFAKMKALYHRIESPVPLQTCDSEEWDSIWRKILSDRRQIIKKRDCAMDEPPSNPVLDPMGFFDDPEGMDMDDMSDGEQAEYFALIDGGGDEAWAAEMFDLHPHHWAASRQKTGCRAKVERRISSLMNKAKCPKCEMQIQLRTDGRFRRHKLPRPTSWTRGKMQYCPASDTLPSEWST